MTSTKYIRMNQISSDLGKINIIIIINILNYKVRKATIYFIIIVFNNKYKREWSQIDQHHQPTSRAFSYHESKMSIYIHTLTQNVFQHRHISLFFPFCFHFSICHYYFKVFFWFPLTSSCSSHLKLWPLICLFHFAFSSTRHTVKVLPSSKKPQ